MNKIIDIYLNRISRTDQGTEGILSVPSLSFSCYALELPWRDNRPSVSCIPPGSYRMSWRISKKYNAFHIQQVSGRSFILIHSGNFAGDNAMGFKSHSEGCILLGKSMGHLQGQRAVLASRDTVAKFNSLLPHQDGRIIISDPPGKGYG